jgi:hypothetical protein
MTIKDFDPRSPNPVTTILRRVSGPVGVARKGGAVVVRKLPQTMKAVQAGTRTATNAIVGLPDTTLRWLAASSIGLGAGLYLSGRRRLTVAAGLAPAIAAAASIGSRNWRRQLRASASADLERELPIAGA